MSLLLDTPVAAVADELNTRPRKTPPWQTLAARLADVTVNPRPQQARVRRPRGARAVGVAGSAGAGRA